MMPIIGNGIPVLAGELQLGKELQFRFHLVQLQHIMPEEKVAVAMELPVVLLQLQ
jgi:hypothetical protein